MRYLLLLLMTVLVQAATYTVKAGGGGDYTTIQACANAMSNGDTCVVYAGTYNEHVTVSAGAVGAYKTLQVNGTDLVYVYDFVVNSYNRIIGFHVQNPSSPSSQDCIGIVNNSTDIYITGNNFYACGFHAMLSGVNSGDSASYVYVQNNAFSYSCSTISAPNTCRGISVDGNHWLFENNDISHVSDGITLSGSNHIIRNNTMHDTSESECGSNSGNCHIDFIESEPAEATQYNLYEGNTIVNNIGTNGHGYLAQGDVCDSACFNLIIRYNVGAHVGSGGIANDNAGSDAVPGFYNVKSYNNTWANFNDESANQTFGITSYFAHRSTGAAQINDLFYYPQSMVDFNPYATDASTVASFVVRNNLAWCVGSPCNLRGKVYSSGSFTDDPGNIKVDPLLANYVGNNFALTSTSPARDAGGHLTTVATADTGSGTSLVVVDAGFFQDGYGIAGVSGDCIAVGTVGNTACISSINYGTNTITLASAITRSDNDPVWLFRNSSGTQVLYGSAPDIGAFEYTPPVSNHRTTGGTHAGGRQ